MSTQKENIKIGRIVDLLKEGEENESFYDVLYNLYVLLGVSKGVGEMNKFEGTLLDEFLAEREALYESYISQK